MKDWKKKLMVNVLMCGWFADFGHEQDLGKKNLINLDNFWTRPTTNIFMIWTEKLITKPKLELLI